MQNRKVIVVLQRGWVVLGTLVSETPDKVTLENTSVIRIWGTTKGLGEIAANGPTKNTILDPCGTVEFHPQTSIMTIVCTFDN